MISKFNLKKKNITIQLTDESILSLKIICDQSVYKFDKDIRSIQKWKFHLFIYKQVQTDYLPKNLQKFRNKFMRLF